MNKRIKKKRIQLNNKKLVKRYPFLLAKNIWTNKPSKNHDYSYTLADDILPGWRKAFGKDFFEELSRRVSDVASDITKKTGDTLEIQKIKSNVRTLKRANERDLADIGRMVYEKFQSGEVSDMDYVTLCEEIEKREEEIEKQEEEIVKIQGEI